MSDPFDLVSAFHDGELTPDERARVEAAAGSDPSFAARLDEVGRVRVWVRDLPPVDPPPGVLDRIVADLRPHAAPRSLQFATWGAAAAAVVLVVGLAPAIDSSVRIEPPVDEATARHEAIATAPISSVRDAGSDYVPVAPDALPADQAPAAVAGSEPVAAFRSESDDVVQIVYGEADDAVSVFVVPGRVEWSAIPADGERLDAGGDPAWRSVGAATPVLVVERDERVFIVVGDVGTEVVESLPSRDADWTDTVRDRCGGVVQSFGFEI